MVGEIVPTDMYTKCSPYSQESVYWFLHHEEYAYYQNNVNVISSNTRPTNKKLKRKSKLWTIGIVPMQSIYY